MRQVLDTHTTRVYGLKVAEHLLKVRGSSEDGSEINREKDQALAAMGESVLSALALESLLELIGCVVADLLVQSKNENSVVISSAPCGLKDREVLLTFCSAGLVKVSAF